LAKSLSHHYPGLLGRFRSKSGLQKIQKMFSNLPNLNKVTCLNVGKLLLLAKQTQVQTEKMRGAELEVTQKLHEET